MTGLLTPFLAKQAANVAAQLAIARARFGKDASTPDEQTLDQILAELNFTGWAILSGDMAPMLDDLLRDQSREVLVRLGIDVEARREVLNIVNADALAYARKRAAEMVGMRFNELGNLVPNPNARWQITEGTRDLIRADVGQAIDEGWSNQELAAKLADNYAFSSERATVIARTETQKATQAGALNSYRASGVVDGKQWQTAEDDRVSEECQANGEAGPNGDGVLRDWNDVYPSGEAAPPSHPNCRCVLVPWFEPNTAATAADLQGVEV